MPVVRSMKDEGSKTGSTPDGVGMPSSPRSRNTPLPPPPEVRPEGGPGEWLQQFAWALEDSNLESAGYFLTWIQSEGEAWATAQALELGVERLRHAPDGKGSAAALVRLYHHLGPLFPRNHLFHELFLERLEQRIRAMAPGAPALTVASAIERALDLFRKGLEVLPAYQALQTALEALKLASNRAVQQEKERELEVLVAGGEHARALELCRQLVEVYQSPLAAGLMPTLLARVGPQALGMEGPEGVAGRRMREWDWPDAGEARSGGRHLRMVRGEREVQIPRTPWGMAFDAPPNPSDYRQDGTERDDYARVPSRPLRRDDPVSLPEFSRAPASFRDSSDPGLNPTDAVASSVASSVVTDGGRAGAGEDPLGIPSPGMPVLSNTGVRRTDSGARVTGEQPTLSTREIREAINRIDAQAGAAEGFLHRDEMPVGTDPLVPPPGSRRPGSSSEVRVSVGADGSTPSSGRDADANGPGLVVRRPEAGHSPPIRPGDEALSEAAAAPTSTLRYLIVAMSLVVALLVVVLIAWLVANRKPETVTVAPPVEGSGTGSAEVRPVAEPKAEPVVEKPPLASGPPGKLTLDITPDDKLELYLDGVYYPEGKISSLSIPSGQHVLEVYRQGYEPFRQELFTNPDLETRVQVALARSPELNLEVTPSDGVAVKINGRLVTAHLPLKNYVVAPGVQTLEISREGYQPHTEEFKATTAASVQLKVTLKPAQ